MTTQVLTGLLVVLPVPYNLLFTLLGRAFDYPAILRQPTGRSCAASPPAAPGWSCSGGGSP